MLARPSLKLLAVAALTVPALAATAVVGAAAPLPDADVDTPSRVVLRDGAGDVWKVNIRTSHWTLVGEKPAADVRRAVVTHRDRAVVVRVRFVDLRRVGVHTQSVGIRTPEGNVFAQLTVRAGRWAGRHALYDEPEGEPIGCSSLSHRIDYASDMVVIRVPRSCLDGPRWVRANLGSRLVVGDRPHRRHFADNPHDDGPYSNGGTTRLYRD